jgi:hypothetical protein
LGGAAAKEGQGAVNALGMGGKSCCFDRARSHPAKIIKGTKNAAYYPKARYSPQSLVRRLASPFFQPPASSYHEGHGHAEVAPADLMTIRGLVVPRCQARALDHAAKERVVGNEWHNVFLWLMSAMALDSAAAPPKPRAIVSSPAWHEDDARLRVAAASPAMPVATSVKKSPRSPFT